MFHAQEGQQQRLREVFDALGAQWFQIQIFQIDATEIARRLTQNNTLPNLIAGCENLGWGKPDRRVTKKVLAMAMGKYVKHNERPH